MKTIYNVIATVSALLLTLLGTVYLVMPTEEAVALELREGKGSWKIDVQKENLFLTNDKEEWLTDELNGFIESTGSPFRARLNCIIICAALTCVFSAVGASREVYWNRRMQQS